MKATFFQTAIVVLIFVAIPCMALSETGGSQDPSQMAADQDFCKENAKISSGYDPENPEASVDSGPPPQRGAGLRGAARGAAKGAVVGGTVEAIGDDRDYDNAAENAAAIGAVSSGLRSRRQARDQAEAQQEQAMSAGASAYTESYNECMKSRGY